MRLGINLEHSFLNKMDEMHEIGIRECFINSGLSFAKHNQLQPTSGGAPTSAQHIELAQKAKSLGWKVTARIWNGSSDLPGSYNWWAGYLYLDDAQMAEYVTIMVDLMLEAVDKLNADALCIATETAQLIHFEEHWHRMLDALPDNVETTYGCHFFQPLKAYILSSFFKSKSLVKQKLKEYGYDDKMPDYVEDWNLIMRDRPGWFDRLDLIGQQPYWLPTMIVDSERNIRRLYERMLVWQWWFFRFYLNYPLMNKKWSERGGSRWHIPELGVLPSSQLAKHGSYDDHKRWWKVTLDQFKKQEAEAMYYLSMSVPIDWWLRMMRELTVSIQEG